MELSTIRKYWIIFLEAFLAPPLKPPNSWCLQYIHFLLGIKLLSMTDVASFSCMCCTPNLSKHNELKWLFSSLLSCETELIAIRTAVWLQSIKVELSEYIKKVLLFASSFFSPFFFFSNRSLIFAPSLSALSVSVSHSWKHLSKILAWNWMQLQFMMISLYTMHSCTHVMYAYSSVILKIPSIERILVGV